MNVSKSPQSCYFCFICDENYVLPTRVAISSLQKCLDKSEDKEYVCYVLSFGLSEYSVEVFSSLSRDGFTVQVKLVDFKDFEKKIEPSNSKNPCFKEFFT